MIFFDFLQHLLPHLADYDVNTFFFVSHSFRTVITSLVRHIELPAYIFADREICLFKCLHLIDLSAGGCSITDHCLQSLTCLHTLILGNNEIITDNCLHSLTQLTSLNLSFNDIITYSSVSRLVNLRSLSLVHTYNIHDTTVSSLTNLSCRILYYPTPLAS